MVATTGTDEASRTTEPVPSRLRRSRPVVIVLALAFFFLELTNPVLWSLPMDMAPDHAGTAGGLMNTGFGVAGILSPAIFGLLVDRTGGWVTPFAVSAGLLVVGGLTSLAIDPDKKVSPMGDHAPADA